jgi:hypothetical protein
MHRCEVAFGLIGVGVWFLARTLVAIVICAALAVPLGILLLFDVLASPRPERPPLQLLPPAPPRQPLTAPLPARRAA